MNEPTITIVDDWKTKERLQLIKNAAQELSDIGVISKVSLVAINDVVENEMANLFH